MGVRLIETKLVTSKHFKNNISSIKDVWAKIAWDIITSGSIKWPRKASRGIGG